MRAIDILRGGSRLRVLLTLALIGGALPLASAVQPRAALRLARPLPSVERRVQVGPATVPLPRYLPPGERRGSDHRGSIILGEMDEREICYDQFLGIHWSDRELSDAELMPAPAYRRLGEVSEPALLLDPSGRKAQRVTVKLTARKPCGKIVYADLQIIRTSCERTGTHFAITALLDQILTPEKLASIAKSLACP